MGEQNLRWTGTHPEPKCFLLSELSSAAWLPGPPHQIYEPSAGNALSVLKAALLLFLDVSSHLSSSEVSSTS